jgi:ATP-dependent Clp protease ATP-binding subunit ClpA
MPEFTSWELDVMRSVRALARRQGRDEIGMEQVALTLLDLRPGIGPHWRSLGIDEQHARRTLADAALPPTSHYGRRHEFHTERSDTLALSPVVAEFFRSCKHAAPDGDTAQLPVTELASTILMYLPTPLAGSSRRDRPPQRTGAEPIGSSPVDRPRRGADNTEGRLLDRHGRDLTELAALDVLDPLIGREREVDRIVRILSRKNKRNPLLVGEPGVGKTAIVEGLAARIAAGNVPKHLTAARIVSVSLASLLGGTRYRGEFESRVDTLVNEVEDAERPTVLFMDEFHLIVTAGAAEGGLDLSSMLLAAMARGELALIGATTSREYREHIRRAGPLDRRMQVVEIQEPDSEQTLKILRGVRQHYASFHQVGIDDGALDTAVRASRHLGGRQPDTALDLLDDACALVRVAAADDAHSPPLVRAEHVAAVAAERAVLSRRGPFRRRGR